MYKIIAKSLSLFFAIPSAYAGCTKPVGTYVGGGGAPIIYSGTTINTYAAQIFSVTISSTGAITVIETGTSTNGGNYSTSYTVASSNNSFNLTTCTGTITNSSTSTTFYAVSDSGATITMISRGGTRGQTMWAPTTYVLRKV